MCCTAAQWQWLQCGDGRSSSGAASEMTIQQQAARAMPVLAQCWSLHGLALHQPHGLALHQPHGLALHQPHGLALHQHTCSTSQTMALSEAAVSFAAPTNLPRPQQQDTRP